MEIGSALYDLSLAHANSSQRFAYRRAARSVLALEQPLTELAGGLRSIPYVGPFIERVIGEHLEQGRSPTVERAIERSERAQEVATARALRTNFLSRAAVLAVLHRRMPTVIGIEDFRGDLQVHSLWSDGTQPIEAMATAARARGHQYVGITDHSYGLRIARGMTMGQVGRQHAEIDRLNRRLGKSFRILKGIEANVRPDGSVDLEPDEIVRFEIVLAAPHSLLRKSQDQTERMLTAVRHPGIHVLAHPRGRMLTRQGVLARWDEVFAEAAKRSVAVEIDGDFHRQDLDFSLAKRALAAGCLFALDSDAHSREELIYTEYAVAHARLAGIPASRVINTWPVEKLLEWARDRSSATGKSRPKSAKVAGSPRTRSQSRRRS